MKEPAPAFQFYPSDFLADELVVAMDNEERGAYITLLCLCWRETSIPADPEMVRRLAGGINPDKLSFILRAFRPHPSDNTRLVHPRLERERLKQKEYKQTKSTAGKKGAQRRWDSTAIALPSQKDGTAIALPMANDSSSSSSSIKKPLPTGGSKKAEPLRKAYGDYQNVKLSDDEFDKLEQKIAHEEVLAYIDQLDGWIEQNPRKWTKDRKAYPTILNWYRRDQRENGSKPERLPATSAAQAKQDWEGGEMTLEEFLSTQ